FWNVFNCFKHYLFRKNSETGVQSGPDYDTLGRYKGSADWKYITFTYDYSEKTNFDQLKTLLRFNLEGATSGTAWVTGIKVEIGSVATDWSPAPEDADGLITEAKATFERTAQGLRTDLSAITEGLRTKVDISALNVTAENIRQSVKSLETDTQNKLNQKLSQAEFEVRADSIRQEILNATKDKADKTLVVSEAGKLREEFSKMKVGGRNLWIKSKTVGAVIEKLPENHVTGQKECYRLENNSTLTFNLEPDFSSRLYQKVTFSAWIKY
ncbi:TPA: peptidase S74, partial [Streptococcus pneumoniae]